jgi:hypothetical protein
VHRTRGTQNAEVIVAVLWVVGFGVDLIDILGDASEMAFQVPEFVSYSEISSDSFFISDIYFTVFIVVDDLSIIT